LIGTYQRIGGNVSAVLESEKAVSNISPISPSGALEVREGTGKLTFIALQKAKQTRN
jgi:hypothetical protein